MLGVVRLSILGRPVELHARPSIGEPDFDHTHPLGPGRGSVRLERARPLPGPGRLAPVNGHVHGDGDLAGLGDLGLAVPQPPVLAQSSAGRLVPAPPCVHLPELAVLPLGHPVRTDRLEPLLTVVGARSQVRPEGVLGIRQVTGVEGRGAGA